MIKRRSIFACAIRVICVLTLMLAHARVCDAQGACQVNVFDDRAIHLHSAQDIATVRSSLIEFIWGRSTLPATHAGLEVTENVANPFDCGGANLARVDRFNVAMGPGTDGTTIKGWAWHFIPVKSNNRLVIVHDGHMACSDFTEDGPDALGLQLAANALVQNGYEVLFVLMPLYVPDQCWLDHSILFEPEHAPADGSALRYFFDTTLESLNYLLTQTTYSDVSMLGLSGGGWTTTLYAALDPRVRQSFPVAGSIPLYLRGQVEEEKSGASSFNGIGDALPGEECNDLGDEEQWLPDLYAIAGYPDLYVMGAYGAGREQVQILNRADNCCFGESQEADPGSYDLDQRTYEHKVRDALQTLASGSFRQEIDEASIVHQISRNALYNIILDQLGGLRPELGGASQNAAFERGSNGHLWMSADAGWTDLGFRTVGTPSVAENAVHPVQAAVRNAVNAPELVYNDGAAWHAQLLPTQNAGGTVAIPNGKIISDPIVTSSQPGTLDIVAQGSDFGFYRWHVTASNAELDYAGGDANSVGAPAIATNDADGLSITYRSGVLDDPETGCVEEPNVVYRLDQDSGGTWQPEQRTNGLTPSFPSAADVGDAIQSILLGEDAQIYAYDAGAESYTQITDARNPFVGTPGLPFADNGDVGFYARTGDADLAYFTDEGAWNYQKLGLAGTSASVVGSPADTTDGVYWTGSDGQARFRNEDGTIVLDSVDTLFRADLEDVLTP